MPDPGDRYHTHTIDETRTLGAKLAASLEPGMLVTFQGELGAGKTTLIQGMLDGLGLEPPFPSPTFILMNQYELKQPSATGLKRVYHADAYRVGSADFEKLGFAEWCTDREAVVFLEWPERIADLLPEKRLAIVLNSLSETEREVTVQREG